MLGWGSHCALTARAEPSLRPTAAHSAVQLSLGGQPAGTGLRSAPVLHFAPVLPVLRPALLTGEPSLPHVLHAALCLQEELTSTSVEHLIINPNAAFEKFKDKRLGTDGVGERRPWGGVWGAGGSGDVALRSSRFLRPHQQEQNHWLRVWGV